ncbi:MAG: M23 family metallopeptidase [Gemmatimonadota bacterium]|nr:M23 family metallopeptidase [Gemmatimonadota bacterium]
MVTVGVHVEGNPDSKSYSFPLWAFKATKVGGIVALALAVIAIILYTPIARTAARVPGLNREIALLRAENEQVRELAAILEEMEGRYGQVRAALGTDVVPESRTESLTEAFDGATVGSPILVPPPSSPPHYGEPGPSLPLFWPIDSLRHRGVLTRGFTDEGGAGDAQPHSGIDIAVARGTPIRASGGGRVVEAGFDAEYGLFVLIDHEGGYRTMYGHAQRLLVDTGEAVDAGQVIALSGTTGRSTAPHLHFEKRRGERIIDPLEPIQGEP